MPRKPRQSLISLLNNYKRRSPRLFFIIVIGLCVVVAAPLAIRGDMKAHPQKSKLYFSEIPGSFNIGQTFDVELRVSSLSTPINAVEVVSDFNPQLLEVVKMTTDQSFCSFYADNTFDNIKGEVHLTCGTPNPGFSGDSTLFTLTMRSKSVGTSEIKLVPKQTAVLANDGKGTNVLNSNLPHLSINVQQTF